MAYKDVLKNANKKYEDMENVLFVAVSAATTSDTATAISTAHPQAKPSEGLSGWRRPATEA